MKPDLPDNASDPPGEGAASGARIVQAFAADLHRTDAGRSANTVTSPWSIVSTLAMCRAGAAGETAAEIDAVLHAEPDLDLPAALGHLDRQLGALAAEVVDDNGGAGEIVIRTANAVWLQSGYPLEPPFAATLSEGHGAPVRTVDFATSAEAARHAINRWAQERTAGRIPHLVAEGAIDQLTRLVLADAVHVRAPWARPFRTEEQTCPFHRLDGSTTPLHLMGAVSRMPNSRGDGWTSVTVAYAGRRLAMTVVVPALGRFAEIDRTAAITEWLDTGPSPKRDVHLRMPEFDLDMSLDLGPVLSAMGMPLAFDDRRADFSAVTPAERIHIGAVAHQATITVDERGTEAAAATAVMMAGRAAFGKPSPPLEITVDRPFLFVLHDTAHRTPLFIGRVTDPS